MNLEIDMETLERNKNPMIANLNDFEEAEYILKNSSNIFKRLEEDEKREDTNKHWLDGYNKEINGRSTFHWATPIVNIEDEEPGRLPRDMPSRWEEYINKREVCTLKSYANKSGELLITKLDHILNNNKARKYIHYTRKYAYTLCRLIRYSTSSTEKGKDRLLAPEHYDPSLLTLLYGSNQSGLELMDNTNKWVSVPHEKQTSIIIYGRWLEYYDDRFKATLHRVNQNKEETSRYSLQTFLLIDGDRLVQNEKIDKDYSASIAKIRLSYKNTFIKYDPKQRWENN